MAKCPLTYQALPISGEKYSREGLKKLGRGLSSLHDLPYTQDGLQREAALRADKMSVQGVQLKLSAVLSIKAQGFSLVDTRGRYILKPQSLTYPALPENEDLSEDQSLVYFIRRFDREGHADKVPLEDFAQLSGKTRDTKYNASMEQLGELIERYCTFPLIEKAKLFQRSIFNFLVGNEDMHLKNFSLITIDEVVRLAPAYDFLNSSLVLRNPEQLALPLRGKKRGLSRKDFVEYFAVTRLGLPQTLVESTLSALGKAVPQWDALIEASFLPDSFKMEYRQLVAQRAEIIFG
jgi:serine/threonine-protein kinase HipA